MTITIKKSAIPVAGLSLSKTISMTFQYQFSTRRFALHQIASDFRTIQIHFLRFFVDFELSHRSCVDNCTILLSFDTTVTAVAKFEDVEQKLHSSVAQTRSTIEQYRLTILLPTPSVTE